MLRAKLMSLTNFPAAAIDTEISRLLPPELVAGVRMDINQPFGNGRDDNGNGIVDDQAESANEALNAAVATFWPTEFPASVPLYVPNGSTSPPQGTTPPGGYPATDPLLVNASGWSPTNPTTLSYGVQARQLMARHLYSIMMLFADTGYVNWSTETTLTAQQQQLLTARRVAQWAINAVSFRDSSSVMIPFMYPCGHLHKHAMPVGPSTATRTTNRSHRRTAIGDSSGVASRPIWCSANRWRSTISELPIRIGTREIRRKRPIRRPTRGAPPAGRIGTKPAFPKARCSSSCIAPAIRATPLRRAICICTRRINGI